MRREPPGVIGVCVAGAAGRLGRLCVPAIDAQDDLVLAACLVRGDDPEPVLARPDVDVLLDVSLPEASRDLVPLAAAHGVRPVVGTSGLHAEDLARFADACARAGVGGLVVPNFSLGAVLQMEAARRAASLMRCTGIHEVHHPAKRDSPSGTALATAGLIGEAAASAPPPVTSARTAGVVAHQEVRFEADGERLELIHHVDDRRAYLPGVLLAIRRVGGLEGLHVGLAAVLDLTPP